MNDRITELEAALAEVTRERDIALRIVEGVMRAPERRCVEDAAEGLPLAIDRLERALLGSLLVEPSLLPACERLRGSDFKDATIGGAFDDLRVFAEEFGAAGFSGVFLFARELERSNRKAPPKGWLLFLSSLQDEAIADEETMPLYVTAIREAAIERRLLKRGVA